MPEILLYDTIASDSAQAFITALNASGTEDLTVRINTPGGEPNYMWGMLAKYSEYKGKKNVKVDGAAYSGGLYFLCYCDSAECLDVSEGLAHRAAYSQWYEAEYMTAAEKENLIATNKNLRAALEAKVDADKFAKETGVTLDELFSMDDRKDVYLDAKQMKRLGLVNSIVTLTPKKKQEIVALAGKYHQPVYEKVAAFGETKPTPDKKVIMDKQTLKAEHREVYDAIIKEALDEERDRVNALLAFVDVDTEGVVKTIKEGGKLTMTAMAELSRKQFSKEALEKIEKENAKEVVTGEATTKVLTEKEKEVATLENKLKEFRKPATV